MDSTICPHCGSPALAGDVRCRVCGAALTSAAGGQPADAGVGAPGTGAAHSSPDGEAPAPSATFGASSPDTRPASGWPAGPPPPGTWPMPGYAWPVPAMGWPSGAPPRAPGAAGQVPGAPAQAPGVAPSYPYPYPYGYPYGYPPYYYYAAPPPGPPRDTYGLVVAWLAIAGGILALLGGIIVGLGLVVVVAASDTGLSTVATLAGFTGMGLIGGVLALVYGIGRVRKLPGRKLSVPSGLLFAALALVALAAGVALWNLYPLPGPVGAVLPLVLLSGVLPALAIVFFGARRLGQPTTTRRFWLSLFYGATGATLLALIIEAILTVIVSLAFGQSINLNITSPANGAQALVLLITLSVIAPLTEEGVKPLAAVLIMRRLRSPAEAFTLGLAAGVGFDIVETIGYIGMQQADWIEVAIERIGAGLLHGVGAGMAALGWYYLINGRGVPNRWLKGIGGLGYAVLQHAIFNGSNLLTVIPAVAHLFSGAWYLGALPVESSSFLFFAYYAIILGVLVYVTGRLARSATAAPAGSSDGTPSQALAGGVR